jgi:hypothetical protein
MRRPLPWPDVSHETKREHLFRAKFPPSFSLSGLFTFISPHRFLSRRGHLLSCAHSWPELRGQERMAAQSPRQAGKAASAPFDPVAEFLARPRSWPMR